LLARGYLGNRLVDGVIPALFNGRVRGRLRDALSLQALTVGALRFIAMRTALTALVAISTAFMRDRPRGAVVIVIALAATPIGVRRLPLPIIALEVQTKLIIRLVIAPALGGIAIVTAIIAEGLTPLVFAPLLFAPLLCAPFFVMPLLWAPLLPLSALSAPLILGRAVARTPRRVTIAMTCVIFVAWPLPPFVGLTLAAARPSTARALTHLIMSRILPACLVGVTVATAGGRSGHASRFTLGIIVIGARLWALIRPAIGIAGPPRFLVILIGRLDHRVEPLANRHARAARGVARGRTRFRTETSQIPRTARSHSQVQAT
jgi:hypothetical protein